MQYLKIKNSGEMEPQALTLVGASTKRGDNSKIGQFGSGNKYALAYLIRNSHQIEIFAGLNPINISIMVEVFRDISFEVIYVNGEKTSITTQMGKDWQLWEALREIYSNSLDEEGSSIQIVDDIQPKAGETHFYIPITMEVQEFVDHLDKYFVVNRQVLYENSRCKILAKKYEKLNLYRRGIRCYDSYTSSLYDYDLPNININESRTITSSMSMVESIWDGIFECTNKKVILNILSSNADKQYAENLVPSHCTLFANKLSQEFREVLQGKYIAPYGMAGYLDEKDFHNTFVLPNNVFDALRKEIGEEIVHPHFKVTKDNIVYQIIPANEFHRATLNRAKEFFKEVKFNVPYEIAIAKFEDKHWLGTVNEGKIILSDLCVERGVNETVNTIIEEYIHLKYDVRDETRAFQTSIISELITYMKNINAIII